MFETNLDQDKSSNAIRRRTFLFTSLGAVAGVMLWSLKQPQVLQASSPAAEPGEVTIVEFSDDGRRLQTAQVPRVVKTEEEWRQQLSANAFDITRHADTEMAFSGQYWNLHDKGLYRCICCNNALFSSETKFESGTGWPSFWAPIAKENVHILRDTTLGIVRDAVACTECEAHLGHVFDDGPQPTGLRYCMNSASLKFVKHA